MTGKIAKEDIEDLDFIDRDELRSEGTLSFKSGVTVVSTTSGTKRVVISGLDLLTERDTPIEPGDKVVLAGTSGGLGNGTFTVNAIVNATTFDVVEAIGTSTGGTADFRYAAGASKVGFDAAGLSHTSATTMQAALSELDGHVNHILRTLPASIIVPAGYTRLQRDTVIPDGIQVVIENTGELLVL